MFQQEPVLRHRKQDPNSASCSEAFHAPDLDAWVRALKNEIDMTRNPQHDRSTTSPNPGCSLAEGSCCNALTAYTVLDGIGVAICEERLGGSIDHVSRRKYEHELLSWYNSYGQRLQSAQFDPLGLMILWHWVFMSLLIDMNRVELAVGKRGAVTATENGEYISGWAASLDSKRCLVHASLLQAQMEKVSMSQAVAFHVPRCLFSAAITWSAYLHSVSAESLVLLQDEDSDSPELRLLGLSLEMQWTHVIKDGTLSGVKGNTLHKLADMLQRTTHWGIAKRFNHILAPLIHGGVDEALLAK